MFYIYTLYAFLALLPRRLPRAHYDLVHQFYPLPKWPPHQRPLRPRVEGHDVIDQQIADITERAGLVGVWEFVHDHLTVQEGHVMAAVFQKVAVARVFLKPFPGERKGGERSKAAQRKAVRSTGAPLSLSLSQHTAIPIATASFLPIVRVGEPHLRPPHVVRAVDQVHGWSEDQYQIPRAVGFPGDFVRPPVDQVEVVSRQRDRLGAGEAVVVGIAAENVVAASANLEEGIGIGESMEAGIYKHTYMYVCIRATARPQRT